jgi:peptidyl-prolyl cis-trans isomerase C
VQAIKVQARPHKKQFRHKQPLRSGAWLVASFIACTNTSHDSPTILVTVDGRPITSADLALFQRTLPDHLRSLSSGETAARDLLQSLVDRELMVLEAEELGYPEEPAVALELHNLFVESVSRRVLNGHEGIGRAAAISDQEIEQTYTDEGWSMVWLAHIVTKSDDEARAILGKLRAGADFAELANEHSSALDALRGGDMMTFFGPGSGRPELVRATRRLSQGEFSDPVVTADGVEVLQVLAVRAVPLREVRAHLAAELKRRKFKAKYNSYLESLEHQFGVTYEAAAVEAIVDADRGGLPLPPEANDLPLVRYRDRGEEKEIGVGRVRRRLVARGFGSDSFADSADVIDAARRWVMADTLFVMAARAAGLLDDVGFKQEIRMRYMRKLAMLLRRRQVLEKMGTPTREPVAARRATTIYLDSLRRRFHDRVDWRLERLAAARQN